MIPGAAMRADKKLLELAETCGLDIQALCQFDDKKSSLDGTDSTLTEVELTRLMQGRSSQDISALNFLAAGSYHYFSPAIIQTAATANKFTSYSDRAGNSGLKSAIESQLVALTVMPYCSLYSADIVTVLASLLKSINDSSQPSDLKGSVKILLPATMSPAIRNALRSQLKVYSIDPVVTDFDKKSGCLTLQQLEQFQPGEIAAIVLPWPNFFGLLEDFEAISRWAKSIGATVIGLVNPLLFAYLRSPADLSRDGVDYLVGDCQVFGLPMNRSGVAPCFVSAKMQRLLPASLPCDSGSTYDLETIQSCLSVMGAGGLLNSVVRARKNLTQLIDKLQKITGISIRFSSTPIHECVIRIAQIDLEKALKILAGHNMVCGYSLADDYPELGDCVLIHCNDRHNEADIEKLSGKLSTVVKNLSTAACPVKPKF